MTSRTLLPWLGWVAFVAVGLLLWPDFGVPWDEYVQREYGLIVHRFVAHGDQGLLQHIDRYHGPLFELLLVWSEMLLGTLDTRTIYLTRHLVDFSFFAVGLAVFYRALRRCFGGWEWALLGSAMIVFCPRLFAHAFFNGKDVPFMVCAMICFYTAVGFMRQWRPGWGVAHGVACGAAIAIRVSGILFVAFPVLLALVQSMGRAGKEGGGCRPEGRAILGVTALLATASGVTIVCWPTLWDGPVHHLGEALRQLSSFPWKASVLYRGEYTLSTDLPWHYTLVWMGITIPLGVWLLGAFGIGRWLVDLWRRSPSETTLPLAYCAGWLGVPLAMTAGLDMTLYDGWRHFFFVFPALVVFAVAGAQAVSSWLGSRRWLWGLAAYGLWVAASMAQLHPYEHVYFNWLAGPKATLRQRFEADYWGTSYLAGLRWLLANDPRERIPVYVANDPGWVNAYMLTPAEARRIAYVRVPEQADYFLTNFRWHREDYDFDEVFAVTAGSQKILAVYRLPWGAAAKTAAAPEHDRLR